MTRKPPVEDVTDGDIEVGQPKTWAAGVPGIIHSMGPALTQMGVRRSLKTLAAMNQKDGFDCMSCAWPDSDHRRRLAFCENGARALTWEATPVTVPSTFWAEHSIRDLVSKSAYWLGMQGRLIEPVHKPAGKDHYQPISWDDAFLIIAQKLKGLDSPDQSAFYTSGRTANETAFIYQLFVRAFGTNNLPDCSNMCHESTGHAMGQTIGIGKSTVSYDDFAKTDLVIVMGQNPGSNHPRMLTALEEAKEAGADIVAINPLPEAGLMRYKNPQRVKGILGKGTGLADQYVQIRLGGDMALMQAISKRVLDAEAANPGTVLDQQFLDEHCQGLEELRAHLALLDERAVLQATGLSGDEIDQLAARYLRADKVIITWAMGLTQHKKAVPTIKEIINLLLLRGNIGKPGAGASPIRGHSNVQGDRTMGIWEQMPSAFLDAIEKEFGFSPPRENGVDSVAAIRGMRDGRLKVWIALGGNLVAAVSDTAVAESALQNTEMTVQISTKLNRSHVIVGDEALILPTMGRSEIDMQAGGPQFVSVEDSVCAVHSSRGRIDPVSSNLLSEVSIVTRLARAVLGHKVDVDWAGFEDNYDVIREHISHVVSGCANYNQLIRREGGFILPNGPRDSRTFPTPTGKAMLTVNELEHIDCPPGRLLLQTMRSHDQFNTTIYSLNDRYRGIKKGRHVIFVNPEDLAELGLADGELVDVHSEFKDNVDRVLRQMRVVSYPSARGCAAAYFPEANELVPLDFTAEGSNTPASKSIVVRLEPSTDLRHVDPGTLSSTAEQFSSTEHIDLAESVIAHNYHPLPVVIAQAHGAWVTDVEGRRYLDALAGYSALNFGHGHPALLAAAQDQLLRATLISRAFHNDRLGPFCRDLAALAGMELVLPMNTGAEAVETAIKVARKWGYEIKGVPDDRANIIVAAGNFHGRTTTIVSFSTDEVARADFGPFTPGFTVVPYGDAAALRAAVTPHTVAVLIEPVQGEAGVIVPPADYLPAVRELCTQQNVLFIADEIQSGLGRTGTTFACELEGVVPDMYILGKALGGGIVPVSAVVSSREILGVLQPGNHGSTFGGNPLAAAVGHAVVRLLATGEYQARARVLGEQLRVRLEALVGHGVIAVRTRGLWAGVDIDPALMTGREMCERLAARGVLAKDTHGSTVRLAPPIVIEAADLDWMVDQFAAVLAEMT